ncbi:MopE-related protein [Chondromyces apiculatus]|uniref:Putative lipoprotein n=1 Tax=Chondromyces apiculatus DSM 436 TaxID=1192034 RepID=A0A017SZJ7_9BACT|nr:MopE-related protein [Chondromyces apiculatus]EYF02010.1 putative lipoprotein [Chondromyces apiculatus DSM 436]
MSRTVFFARLASPRSWLALTFAAAALVAAASGCSNPAYCFDDCPGDATTVTTGTQGSGGDGVGGCLLNCGGSGGNGGAGGQEVCVPDDPPTELCDNRDNDCNGFVDDIFDIDYEALTSCGTCSKNCLQELLNNDPDSIACVPSTNPGVEPGTCSGSCAADYHDLDGNGSCEYYCLGSAQPEALCNGIDDDCDGAIDEDVNRCDSTADCGACGYACSAPHATPSCLNNGQTPCTLLNTHCVIDDPADPSDGCECSGPGNCWWDLDGVYATGCEYQCDPTNNGVEICGDGIDNDCDGLLDGADDLSGDPSINVPCFGDPDGVCATTAHAGMTACINGQVTCAGPNVLIENQSQELCNGLDDDCDGQVDDNPSDIGGSCGVSNVFPCSFGTYQCLPPGPSDPPGPPAPRCVGAINPGIEICNGIDDDCDSAIDFTVATSSPPTDIGNICGNTFPPPPPGVPTHCSPGTSACVGGVLVCQNAVGPLSLDTCGVDADCNGSLTNQPNFNTDVANCGACGNNCYATSVHSIQACVNGSCQSQGCQPGYWDLDNDGSCEYACSFVQAQEVCNGEDDDCDGQIDEGVIAPSPVQICGVSPSATSPECTTGVTVTCNTGAWQCSFPPGVCSGNTCAATPELCDNLDNNCNGINNENVPSWGQPCSSDDGQGISHGACRTSGTYVCSSPTAVTCNAVKANCASLPGGCTEACDGIDNDCDGSVDETFNSKGSDPAYFVRPTVTRITGNTWVYTYEASRANAPTLGATDPGDPGSGNGYHCSGSSCPAGIPAAPAGVTLDRTRSCSVQNRIPWFNVTPVEAEQTCNAAGGTLCSTSVWTTACMATNSCTWGYSPANAACTSVATATKRCNLGPTFDTDTTTAGDQDVLLRTGSSALSNCWANWGAAGNLFDITGNLREITKSATNVYPLMGGAYNSAAENGATCSFQFYKVDTNFKLFDTGFRCCFTSDPTL